MKKAIILAILFILSFVTCSKNTINTENSIYKTIGWIDDNTFRIKATGIPTTDLLKKSQRQKSAKKAALINAQNLIIENFINARIEGATSAADYAYTSTIVAKEFEGIIYRGSIVKETYDEDDNCEVIYQVEKKNLKKEVMGGTTATN